MLGREGDDREAPARGQHASELCERKPALDQVHDRPKHGGVEGGSLEREALGLAELQSHR